MKCLTPDEDETEETEDIEAYMSSQVDSGNQNKQETIVSPLPDVTFEIHKGQLPELVPEVNIDLKDKEEETPDATSAEDVEEEKVEATNKDVDIDTDSVTPVVGFTTDEEESNDNLDEMLDNLEADPSLSEIVDPVVAVDSNVEPQENLVEAVLAATADDTEEIEVATVNSNTETKEDNNTSTVESATPETENVAETPTAEVPDQEVENEVTVEGDSSTNLTESVGTAATGETEGNTELRTSLKRTGSTSGGTGRRVRFSLEPQYEGEGAVVSGTEGNSTATPPESVAEGKHLF